MPSEATDFFFCLDAYSAPNYLQDAQQCINWYPEIDKNPGAKTIIALLGCPGLVQVASVQGL